MKNSKSVIEKEGKVIDLNRGNFKVELDDMDLVVTCKKSGKLDHYNINILPGDKVVIEISPYDLNRGRITKRLDNKERVSNTYNQRRAKTVRQEQKKAKREKRREEKKANNK